MQLNVKTVLFQIIQFSIGTQFSSILPRDRARVDLGEMAMKGCSAFPKAPASLEPHHQIVVISMTHVGGGSSPCAEMQLVYCTAPADWAIHLKCFSLNRATSKRFPSQ